MIRDAEIVERKRRLYDYRGFTGTDVSIDISLFEYGLIWQFKKGNKKVKDYFHFVYATKRDEAGNALEFSWSDVDADISVEEEYDWVNWDGLFEYLGVTRHEFFNQELPRQISDLISHDGVQNVFGDTDYSFEISGSKQ